MILFCRPTGQFAYAFAKTFLVVYDLNGDTVSTQLGNTTWPDTSFLPYAVDVSNDLLFVVLGYVGSSDTSYTPCAYLLNISNSTFNVLDTWSYTPPSSTSWQASLTNWDADVYAAKYGISVSINNGGDQVLFGIQITNSIMILDIDRINMTFGSSLQTLPNGKALGMGKSVDWLGTDLIFVLVNIYSFSYIWSSSQVFTYNITVPNTFVVRSIFPNIQQTLANTFGPTLVTLTVTQNGTLAMIDSDGTYYILLPSPLGSLSDSSLGTSSSSLQCTGGTFASEPDIFPCSLCPSGTTTNGLLGQSSCTSCTNNTFCPLGAAFGNISSSSSVLANLTQVIAYPVSPQSVRFDNILMENMFKIHTSLPARCLLVSPLFWAIVVISLGIIIWLSMFVIKHYVSNPLGKKTHYRMKQFLKKSDLIGEGEMVIGGLFSFSILVLIVFAYTFSNSYLYRYPIEKVTGTANLACDQTVTNAQFSSTLMALGIPPEDDEAPIFALLDDQTFTLNIVFINTLFICTDVSVMQIKDISIPMTVSSCNDNDGSVSIAILLPSHSVNLQVTLTGTNTIGGIHVGLEGLGVEEEDETLDAVYTLVDLVFAQTLSVSGRMLTQQPSCTLQLTKVINRTYALSEDGETQFSAVWLPTFTGGLDQMFVDESEYKYATSSSTILSIVISETAYYTLNVERPITDEDELIFTNLLFTIVCLEIFGLGFLIFKLIIIPLFKYIFDRFHRRASTEKSSMDSLDLTQTCTTHM